MVTYLGSCFLGILVIIIVLAAVVMFIVAIFSQRGEVELSPQRIRL